ncbi:hypothetical protein OH492_23890 [Vibrio chagasii]|nr:hypothetical protein [Vibrio chagasii]
MSTSLHNHAIYLKAPISEFSTVKATSRCQFRALTTVSRARRGSRDNARRVHG